MSRKVSSNLRLVVILLVALIGASLNFFLGSMGGGPIERIFLGGMLGGIAGQLLISLAD